MQKLIVKKGKERSMTNRHPWIYSGAVATMPKAADGEIIEIYDADKKRIGYGFFSLDSQISCRVFEFGEKEVDCQAFAYWEEKILKAFALRKSWVIGEQTNAYRLINAEGDFFPGLIADVYGQVVVLHLGIKATELLKPMIVSVLQKIGFQYIYFKTKENSVSSADKEAQGWLTAPYESTTVVMQENGIKFKVDFEKGQKTGFFLDQRDNRALLGHFAAGKKVLNTFCYSGGFSLYALQNGAALVHSVDSSAGALALCKENVRLNFGEQPNHETFEEDCFKFLKNMKEQYDIIVVDPPAFAKNVKSIPNATRGYKELNLLAFKQIKSGGLVFTFSCSQKIDRDLFRKVIFGAAADAGRNVRVVCQLSQPIDHPINIYHPENEYLKGLVLQVE